MSRVSPGSMPAFLFFCHDNTRGRISPSSGLARFPLPLSQLCRLVLTHFSFPHSSYCPTTAPPDGSRHPIGRWRHAPVGLHDRPDQRVGESARLFGGARVGGGGFRTRPGGVRQTRPGVAYRWCFAVHKREGCGEWWRGVSRDKLSSRSNARAPEPAANRKHGG